MQSNARKNTLASLSRKRTKGSERQGEATRGGKCIMTVASAGQDLEGKGKRRSEKSPGNEQARKKEKVLSGAPHSE